MKNLILTRALLACFAAALSSQAVAGTIAVVGNNNVASFLNSNGHTATAYGSAGSINYAGLDAVILMRTSGDASVSNFVFNGGLLITEWDATWTLNTANLLTPTDTGHPPYRPSDPVAITSAGIAAGLAAGMSNPFLDGGQSQHYRGLSGIGPDVEVLLEWSSDNVAVAIGGSYGAGSVLVNTLDWGDGFNGNGINESEQMLLNMLNYSYTGAAVPAPMTVVLFGLGMILLGMSRKRGL
ncbi:MAG: PEP-CTERM sorting domain-containing protein [Pseudomonadota bacterium]